VLNDNNAKVNVQGVQLMRWVMCYFSKNSYASSQSSTKSRKGFITYNPKHGIMAMKKHVTNEHGPNLVKYIVHKISLKAKDSNIKINVKIKHLSCLQPSLFFLRCEAL
jgi:hypothetical protein